MSEKAESYYKLLDQWLNYYGFQNLNVNEHAGADKVYLRSRIEAAKFGNVSFYICAKHLANADAGSVREFSSKATVRDRLLVSERCFRYFH
jgi:hypothetical protein